MVHGSKQGLTHWDNGFVPFLWSDIRPFIEVALRNGSQWTIGDVYQGLICRDLDFFTIEDGELQCVLVTWIYDDTCVLLTLGGFDMDKWIHNIGDVEAWARDRGCKKMKIQGRRGWSRVLGYEITGHDEIGLTIMEKML